MAKKNKVRVDRLVLLGLVFLALLCVFIIGVYSAVVKLMPENSSTTETTTTEYNEKGYKYSIVSSVVYKTGLNYDFSIVTLNLSGDLSKASLSDFTTSDNVNLGEIDTYIQYFKDNNIEMNYDYVTSIASSGSNEVVSVFVPVLSDSLIITDGMTKTEINLNKNTITIRNEELDPVSYDVELTVNDGYPIEYIQVNGEDFSDSAYTFYQFTLTVTSNPNNVSVVSGSYTDANGKKYEILDSSVSSRKLNNLIGVVLNDNDGLFIRVLKEDNIAKNGNLTLNFSDGTTITYEVKIK